MTPRVRLFHWKAAEAEVLSSKIRAAGYAVDYSERMEPGLTTRIRKAPPDLFVIDLSRLPSHGREVAIFVRGSKTTRNIPIVFLAGSPEKVEAIQKILPDAVYSTQDRLKTALQQALETRPVNPIAPPQMMNRYAGRTVAQKLGIRDEATVALIDAPRSYAKTLGDLPPGAKLLEDPREICVVTLWFVHSPDGLRGALSRMRSTAGKTKLWVLWPKLSAKPDSGLNEQLIRESGIAFGLVDYKVCAFDQTWSALCFALKRK